MGGKEQNCPVYVSRIIPDGVAAKHGGLKVLIKKIIQLQKYIYLQPVV